MFRRPESSRASGLLLEILMIVIGINVALWFEGMFDDMADRAAERQYLVGLRDDLETDIETLDRVIRFNSEKMQALSDVMPKIPGIVDLPPGEQTAIVFEPSNYDFFETADFTLRSMQESGDFRLLSDDDIKRDLLKLARTYRFIERLQTNFLQAMDDEYVPILMRSFDIAGQRLSDPAVAENQIFRNFFPFALDDTRTRVAFYERAREQATELKAAIDAQLADD